MHADRDGNLAVMAVMFEIGEKNKELEKSWAYIPKNTGEKHALPKSMDANILLPKARDYYRYNGSLTTPPCSEGVLWLVMKHFNTADKDQIDKFTRTMHHPNNRPVQSLKARAVLK